MVPSGVSGQRNERKERKKRKNRKLQPVETELSCFFAELKFLRFRHFFKDQ